MKQAQRIIKYVAIAFGLYLAINIIGWIIFGFTMLLGIDIGRNIFIGGSKELVQYGQTFSNVEELDIEIAFSDLEIKIGDELKVEGQIYEDYKIEAQNKILKIEDTGKRWNINANSGSKLTLYIPKDFKFNKAKIEIGAGTTNIEKLSSTELDLNLGAGAVKIQNCEAEKTDIECGAGKVTIENSSLKDLKLNAGVGELHYNGYILGRSQVECGIGKLTLDLAGGEEIYSIEAEHGIGEIKLNGSKIEDNQTKGSGENKIKIEGGIGEIQINM